MDSITHMAVPPRSRARQPGRTPRERSLPLGIVIRSTVLGVAAALVLLGSYLGLVTLAQDWSHAGQQFASDRWSVLALTTGFGLQVGLFSYLHGLHVHATAGGVAASAGTSTAAMLACCAHHVADVLPILGLSGAALFLSDYKTELLWLGIAMNLAGIVYLVRRVRHVRGAQARRQPVIGRKGLA